MNERTLFTLALDIAPADREQFLRARCGDDVQLVQRVQTLLKAHDRSNQLLSDEDLQAVGRWIEAEAIDEGLGDEIEGFQLLEVIGEGGFGRVYKARQANGVTRTVAVKVLKPGMDSRQVVARFEAERQALAMLDHPGIAKVLHAGATTRGRLYFVMEFVDGLPITEFCDQNQLSIEDRLRLLTEVCLAVSHAHQRGLIHRDLKPSNILVSGQDDERAPRIIDFGIAKAIGQSLTDKTILTRHDQRLGTPQYMSPEQSVGGGVDVDTRSDVFSLGVVMYELITGTTPLERSRVQQSTDSDVMRLIQNELPEKPSYRIRLLGARSNKISADRRTDESQLRRAIQGDIEWIVLKALEKDREHRYASVRDLAVDIQRYLDREPVLAGPPNVSYRMRSFVRRYRKTVIAVAAIVCLLVAGLIGTLLSYRAAVRARDQATRLAYASDLDSAGRVWESPLGHARDVQSWLDRQVPSSSEQEDLREFAWRLLWSEIRSSRFASSDAVIRHLRVLADGRYLSIDEGHTVQLWDPVSAASLHRWAIKADGIRDVDVSPDGLLIAVATGTGVVALDALTSQQLWSHREESPVYDVKFSQSGEFLLGMLTGRQIGTLSDGAPQCQGEARTWRAANGEEVARALLIQHEGRDPDGLGRHSWTADVANDGMRVMLAYHPSPFHFAEYRLDHANAAKAATFFKHRQGSVYKFAYGPAGRRGVSSGAEGAVQFWDLELRTGARIDRHVVHTGVAQHLTLSNDGALLATGAGQGSIQLFDFKRATRLRQLKGHVAAITALAFAPDNSLLVSADRNGILRRWDLSDSSERHSLGRSRESVCSPNGKWLAVSISSKEVSDSMVFVDDNALADANEEEPSFVVELRRLPSRELVHRLDVRAESMAFSGDSRQLAIGMLDYRVSTWDVATGTRLRLLETEKPEWKQLGSTDATTQRRTKAGSVAYSPNGRYLAAGFGSRFWRQPDYEQVFSVWDLRQADEPITIQGHQNDVKVSFSPDETKLATCSDDGTVRLWSTRDWDCLTQVDTGRDYQCVHFSPSGQHLFVGDADGGIEMRDVQRRGLPVMRRFSGHARSIHDLKSTRDGLNLISCSRDRTIRIWDLRTGRPTRILSGYTRHVTSLSLSQDNRQLVYAADDVRIILVPTIAEIDDSDQR